MRNYRAYYAKEFADYQKLKRFKKLEKQKKKRELKKLNLKASSLEEVSNQHKYVGGEWT